MSDNEPRERELKLLLDREADWRTLVEADDVGERRPTLRQVSHYFDTAALNLAFARGILRLREATSSDRETPGCGSSEWTAGFKQGADTTERPGYFDSTEIEERVSALSAERWIESPGEFAASSCSPAVAVRERFGLLALERVGSIVTERRRIQAPFGLLEIDRVTFPRGPDLFELEIESDRPDQVLSELRILLARKRVRAEPHRRTKLEELLRRLGRIDGGRAADRIPTEDGSRANDRGSAAGS